MEIFCCWVERGVKIEMTKVQLLENKDNFFFALLSLWLIKLLLQSYFLGQTVGRLVCA